MSVVERTGGRYGGADAANEGRGLCDGAVCEQLGTEQARVVELSMVSLGGGLDSRKEDATVFRMQVVPPM